jgi:hypothetical protein
MAAADMTAEDATGPDLVVPKEEPLEDGFTSSSVSSPEPDGERGPTAQDAAPVQKRKGGRKPVSPLPSTSLSVLFMSTRPLWQSHPVCHVRAVVVVVVDDDDAASRSS